MLLLLALVFIGVFVVAGLLIAASGAGASERTKQTLERLDAILASDVNKTKEELVNIRKEELFARYGGEEFAIILPETSREGALSLCERLRRMIESHPFQYEERSFHVTVSIGVATTHGEPNVQPVELLRQADEKLYQAKREGRNRVVS